MVSAGSYILSALELAALVVALGFSSVRLRSRLMPTWTGAPARLVEAVTGIALLIWLSELLGAFSLFYGWAVVVSSLALAGAIAWRTGALPSLPAGGAVLGDRPEEQLHHRDGGSKTATGPAGPGALISPPVHWFAMVVTVGVVGLVVAHWGLTTKDALDRGIFNFDSLWYHLPFAVDMVQSHSVVGMHYVDTVFTNWFYPQNSELLHAVGIAIIHRDTLSLFLNFGWLAVAFLAAWCIGRPYGRGPLTVTAAALLLESHILIVREPAAAKNDLVAAALLLAAIAILVNAWAAERAEAAGEKGKEKASLPVGWPLAVAGLAVGLAAGTKVTALAMAAALTIAVLVMAPAGRRRAAAGWWFVPALLGGGFWYLRNLVVAGNPLPEVERLGPISLSHPEHLQTARPDFSIAHYATDTGVWRDYFAPGLHHAFGGLWPLVVLGAIAGAVLALAWGRDRVLRWMGGVALFGLVAYLFTPLSAAGPDGAPDAFAINIRYLYAALLASLTLLPLARGLESERRRWLMLGALLVVLLLTTRSDAVLRDPSRIFGVALAFLLVLVPAGLLFARARGAGRVTITAGFAVLAVVVVAVGYPVQRHYLRERFRNAVAETSIPGMDLNSAYRWARDTSDLRIGLVGTSAEFSQYGFYGTDLSNRVVVLGEKGPHGAFNAIPTCRAFRTAVNEADLDYLVTAPFLNFIHPGSPIASPEGRWLRDEPSVTPVDREGQVTVWKIPHGLELDPLACGPANAPLRQIPNAPGA
ncbi:MAG TPA: hypothetical protein VII45_02115 [Solirubrobacterales bacterium]